MGFFSRDCEECGQSIRAPYDLTDETQWLNAVVAVTRSGRVLDGNYDGYGRIGQGDVVVEIPEDTTWRHNRCAERVGDKGRQFAGVSKSAPDQGYFTPEKMLEVFK